jgi:hypothetical protein
MVRVPPPDPGARPGNPSRRKDTRTRSAFAAVIGAQAAHSVEEYVLRLCDVFAPARFVSGLFSHDLATGFALANALVACHGAACAARWPGPPLGAAQRVVVVGFDGPARTRALHEELRGALSH